MMKTPYHIVQGSPWPLITSMGICTMVLSMTLWLHYKLTTWIMLSLSLMAVSTGLWWWDVSDEAKYLGYHTTKVQTALSWGMMLFISSEVMFFFGFFWAFFHSSLTPSTEVGMVWPPSGITPLNPYEVPLLNTTILLSSGATVTASHHLMMNNNIPCALSNMMLTIFLGVLFTCLQWSEYLNTEFSICDSVYGSVFFVATGFHGLHVIIGTTFLTVVTMRMMTMSISMYHHFSFEGGAWYWHFVDVVWIFRATFYTNSMHITLILSYQLTYK